MGEPGAHGRELIGALARAGGRDRFHVRVAGPRERASHEGEPPLADGVDLEPPRSQQPRVLTRTVQGRGERAETIADRGGLLVSLGVRQPTHPRLERSEEPVRGLEGGEEIPDELSVALGVDRAVARGGTPADVGEGARGEAGPCAHRSRAAPERDDLFQRLLRQACRSRARERPEVGAAVVVTGPVDDLEARERLAGVELQVGEPPPGLPPSVVLRLVPSDQPRLEDERLELATRRLLTLHSADLAEEVLDLLALVAVEVGLHAGSEVAGLPDVEDAVVGSHEAVDTGRVGEFVREPDLAEVRPSARTDRLPEVAEREDPEPGTEVEEPVEDLGAGHRIVERPVDRLDPGAEVLRERLETDVGDVGPHDTPRELGGTHRWPLEHRILQPLEVHVQEREVEPRVVRDEDRASSELEERGEDGFDRRLPTHEEVIDAGQVRDEGRDGLLGIDQRLEGAEPLAAQDADRADLRDAGLARGAAGGLEVDDDERDLPQRHALLEGGLNGCRQHGRLRSVGPTGRLTLSNRCSMVKERVGPSVRS